MNKRQFIVCLSLVSAIAAQDVVLKGQLWGAGTYGNDPAPEYGNATGLLGYLPMLSLAANNKGSWLIDFEWAGRMAAQYTGAPGEDTSTVTVGKNHRLWARLSSEKFEIRAGLQKMAFGPGMVLRPLMWYDTLDLRDPTGQTDGTEALRVRYFGGDNWSLAGWLNRLNSDFDMASGGRLELTTPSTEIGLTFHYQAADTNLFTSQVARFGRQRIAFDLRYDGFIGAWTEIVYGCEAIGPDVDVTQIMIGADYTLGIGQGIYVINENLYFKYTGKEWDPVTVSVLMASVPMGFIDQLTAIVQYDWDKSRAFNYLRWSRTYDHLSFNVMLGANPGRSGVEGPLSSFGESIQLMMIYNH
ncbi:hypothetical protein ACFL6E_03320 [Candidatus Neomarinimicrobiota bacterium]